MSFLRKHTPFVRWEFKFPDTMHHSKQQSTSEQLRLWFVLNDWILPEIECCKAEHPGAHEGPRAAHCSLFCFDRLGSSVSQIFPNAGCFAISISPRPCSVHLRLFTCSTAFCDTWDRVRGSAGQMSNVTSAKWNHQFQLCWYGWIDSAHLNVSSQHWHQIC